MKFVLNLLEKLFQNSKSKHPDNVVNIADNISASEESEKELSPEEKYLCGLSFYLDEKSDVHVSGFIPDAETIGPENVSTIAEHYAQLILAINKGLLKDKILLLLKDTGESSENPNEKLFIDNVILFYNILKDELAKIQSNKGPLIKPSSVFKAK